MAVTIYDVARHVGVSVKTVSRAINDHPDVSASTRAAVLEAARALGFRPNPLARGLSTGSTGMIGLLVPELLNPHYAEGARHMQALANAEGYMLVIADSEYDLTRALANLRSFIAHRVDGLIWNAGLLNEEGFAMIRAAKLPTVVGEPLSERLDHVRLSQTPTYAQATYAAMEHLFALGHERVAYVTESSGLSSVLERLSAFRQALADHDLPIDHDLIRTSDYLCTDKLAGGYLAMSEMLDEGRRFTAVCTSSDLAAIGIMRALREHGLRVPADVSIVGCDDVQQASYTDPPLTTIHTPYAEITAANFHLLLHLIDPHKWPEPVVEVGHTFVVRTSTGPAPTAHARSGRTEKGGIRTPTTKTRTHRQDEAARQH